MNLVQEIIAQFGSGGVDTTFEIDGRTYHVFAYPSPGRDGPRIRWNLYQVDDGRKGMMHGLTFGLADGVREALEDVVGTAKRHARDQRGEHPPNAAGFRPPEIE